MTEANFRASDVTFNTRAAAHATEGVLLLQSAFIRQLRLQHQFYFLFKFHEKEIVVIFRGTAECDVGVLAAYSHGCCNSGSGANKAVLPATVGGLMVTAVNAARNVPGVTSNAFRQT